MNNPLEIKGFCEASALSEADINRLVSVEDLLIVKDHTFNMVFPCLKKTGGIHAVRCSGLEFPVLDEVTGQCTLISSENINFPVLCRVGSVFNARNTTNVNAPKLESAHKIHADSSKNLNVKQLNSVSGLVSYGGAIGLIIPKEVIDKQCFTDKVIAEMYISPDSQNISQK